MLGIVPKSAKHWARTAHLHDVKSAKKRQEQARIELARPEGKGKGKRERMEADMDDDSDVFLEKRSSRMALMHRNDAVENLSNSQCLLLELGSDVELHDEPSTDVSLVLPVGEDSDLWVDTDSASADDGSAETFDLSFAGSTSHSADDLVIRFLKIGANIFFVLLASICHP